MNRAQQFGNREAIVNGGNAKAVYTVVPDDAGADYSRGVRGNSTPVESEILPRPLVDSVKSEMETRNGVKLKAGDVRIIISSTALDESFLRERKNQLRLGVSPDGELLQIVDYVVDSVFGSVMRFTVYGRGIVNQ